MCELEQGTKSVVDMNAFWAIRLQYQ